nr:unnamed protein product [Callosobruchus chinensis]
MKSGSGSDSKYDSTWFAYRQLLFIADSVTPRQTKDSIWDDNPATSTLKRYVNDAKLSPVAKNRKVMANRTSAGIASLKRVSDFSIVGLTISRRVSNFFLDILVKFLNKILSFPSKPFKIWKLRVLKYSFIQIYRFNFLRLLTCFSTKYAALIPPSKIASVSSIFHTHRSETQVWTG